MSNIRKVFITDYKIDTFSSITGKCTITFHYQLSKYERGTLESYFDYQMFDSNDLIVTEEVKNKLDKMYNMRFLVELDNKYKNILSFNDLLERRIYR